MKEVLDFSLYVRRVLVSNLLFCILLSAVPVYQGTYCGSTLSRQFSAAENRALRNAAFWSGRVGSAVRCVSLCHSWSASCKSVNYFKNDRKCELNNITRVDGLTNFVVDYSSEYLNGNGDTPEFSVAAYSGCKSLLKAGYNVSTIYTIFPAGFADGLRVYCGMETDGGGWLVIQRRQDGSVDFYRGSADYRVGFGDLAGEFWLGNDNLRTLSNSTGSWDLRIDLEDWDGNTAWAKYEGFRISGEDYRLSFDSYNSQSTAGDSLVAHKGQLFSTMDKDSDDSKTNCAVRERGAWWYKKCSHSNLNGMYFNSSLEVEKDYRVIAWYSWRGFIYSMKSCSMKIRWS